MKILKSIDIAFVVGTLLQIDSTGMNIPYGSGMIVIWKSKPIAVSANTTFHELMSFRFFPIR